MTTVSIIYNCINEFMFALKTLGSYQKNRDLDYYHVYSTNKSVILDCVDQLQDYLVP